MDTAGYEMTPFELEKIGKRLYGPYRWRSKLALNLGIDIATVHRWGKRDGPLSYMAEVAVKGLAEQYRAQRKLDKLVQERLRRQGRLRPKLRRRKKVAIKNNDVLILGGDNQ